jgi:carboxyl-terminal processing protease
VIAHEDVGMDLDIAGLRQIHQAAVEVHAVAVRAEDRLPVVAPDDEVFRQAGDPEARKSGHEAFNAPYPESAYVQLDKFESDPIYDYGMRLLLLAAALVLSACAGMDPYNMIGRQLDGEPGASNEVVPSPPRGALHTREREAAFDFVWRTIERRYYDPAFHGVDWKAVGERYRPLAMKALDDEAFWDVLDRMTGELKDAHTRVESPKHAALRKLDQAVTLGFSFVPMQGKLAVTAVNAESDAWWAGVRPGMLLVSIAGEEAATAYERLIAGTRYDSTERSRHLRAVRRLIAGDEGTTVAFTFERSDGSRFDAQLGRSKLTFRPMARHRVLPTGFGYLRITQWTFGVLPSALEGLEALKDTPGIVIDLRGNPGGSLHVVNAMLGKFFTRKTGLGRVITRTGEPVSMFFGTVEIVKLRNEVAGDKDAYKGPVVILVNASSGSGSEFFAATMQATGRAVIAGEPSCGCLLGFLGYARIPGGGELAYSEVGFVMANGKRIEGEGVLPDHHIALTLEDLRASRDRILEQAQEILRNLKAVEPVAGG